MIAETIDNRGVCQALRTRPGADLTFEVVPESYETLAGNSVRAFVYDGPTTYPLDTTVTGTVISVTLPHAITAVLGDVSRYSVSLVEDLSGLVTPLVYGPIYTDRSTPV